MALFIKTGSEQDLTHGLQFADFCFRRWVWMGLRTYLTISAFEKIAGMEGHAYLLPSSAQEVA
jgi:hypothetical protein